MVSKRGGGFGLVKKKFFKTYSRFKSNQIRIVMEIFAFTGKELATQEKGL